MRRIAVARSLVRAGLLVWAAGCRDVGGPAPIGDSLPGLVVSDPVPGPSAGPDSVRGDIARSTAGGGAGDTIVYISMGRGFVADGVQATILNLVSGQSVRTGVVDGGFDPAPLAANDGDSIAVVITRSGSAVPFRQVALVRVKSPPRVVRTDPPPRRLDVPLNSIIEIVFSTPIDSATLTGTSLQLMQGSTPVAGTTAFGDPGHLTVVFTPAAPLVPRTPYRLVATTAIADLHGSTLAANVETDFSTGDAAAATIASVTVVPDTVTVTTGNTVQVVAVVRDPQGATVPGVPVTWASDSTSVATVSSGGLVTTLGPGRATISASAAGLVGTARVTVSPTSISSITVTPDSATIVLGDSIRLTAQARDAKGAVIAGAPITWGTNDVTIVTVDQSGLVKPLAPGTATVEAFGGPAAGPHFGSARITVTAPSGAGPTP